MKRYLVLPHKQGSKSAKALADALGGKVLKLEGSGFIPKSGDVIINWGNTTGIDYQPVVNNAAIIKNASNKLNFFKRMKEKGLSDIIPPFWTNRNDIPEDAYPVVCRTVLAGHSGDGIVIADTPDDLVTAPLYVRYMKKKDEYRVHCGTSPTGPVVIAVQRKARRLDCEAPNWKVRNHANGFIYARSEVNPAASVIEVALQSLGASQLDFGAVDVIFNEHEGKAYVLEINTAPGLEGQTVTDYTNFFKGIL